jgi:transketolase
MKIDMRDAFFEELAKYAKIDKRIIILSADHGALALEDFAKNYPEQYVNIGIAEQNMVGVAAGLAASGKIVFIYGISPFVSLRVLEQITIDVAAMQLPVNIISVGGGFTYSTDGPTHHGLQDIAVISSIPGMTILNSSDPVNTREFVKLAILSQKPNYIRIEKEKLKSFDRITSIENEISQGFSILLNDNPNTLIVSTGYITSMVFEAMANASKAQIQRFSLIDVHRIKPFPEALINTIKGFKNLIVLEESYTSTIASKIALLLARQGLSINIRDVVVGDEFVFLSADRNTIMARLGLSKADILEILIHNAR